MMLILDTLSNESNIDISEESFKLWLLNKYIRSHFAVPRPSIITSQGRKSIIKQQLIPTEPADLHGPMPWRDPDVCFVLQWTIQESSELFIRSYWHLFVPPILTLLDESQTEYRLQGLLSLRNLLRKTSSLLLLQTGTGEIFEDAIMPTLLFLPRLTPSEECHKLLTSAYDVLFLLSDVRYSSTQGNTKRSKSLQRILREGVLHGLSSARDDALVLEVLMKQLSRIVRSMGIQSVKYLKVASPPMFLIVAG